MKLIEPCHKFPYELPFYVIITVPFFNDEITTLSLYIEDIYGVLHLTIMYSEAFRVYDAKDDIVLDLSHPSITSANVISSIQKILNEKINEKNNL